VSSATLVAAPGPFDDLQLTKNQLARRQAVIDAALAALHSDTFENIKITDIARDSGVALSTVYRYFASKEHLFAAAFHEWQLGLKRKLITARPSGDTEADRLRSILDAAIRAFHRKPQFYRLLLMLNTTTDPHAAAVYQSLSPLFRDTFLTAVDRQPDRAGGPDPCLDSDHVAIFTALSAVLETSLRSWVMGRAPIEQVYRNVHETLRLIYEFPRP
jgi:TetR/AcrR family transcriptional regulator, cholesterol catabolism regulator